MLPKEYVKLWPSNLPDAKLTEALAAIVRDMDPEQEKVEEALIWLQVIDTTRLKRNLVGHFAGTLPSKFRTSFLKTRLLATIRSGHHHPRRCGMAQNVGADPSFELCHFHGMLVRCKSDTAIWR